MKLDDYFTCWKIFQIWPLRLGKKHGCQYNVKVLLQAVSQKPLDIPK
jgi:hypothetical protein